MPFTKSAWVGKEVRSLDIKAIRHQRLALGRRTQMAGSTYKSIELVGTSNKSWEDAAKTAIEAAGESLKELRIAEITKLDMTIENGKVTAFRARLNVSFKYVK